MGTWSVDGESRPGILVLRLEGHFGEDEMRAFLVAHNAAIDAFRGADYRVLCDIRELRPLSPEAAAMMEKAKHYSSLRKNFQGSAVLVASKVVAMQHQRTSVSGGVMSTELISEDEAACERHLARIRRA